MFGEESSESPRRPSPWRVLSPKQHSAVPSPMSLGSSALSTSFKDRPTPPSGSLRNERSLETLLSSPDHPAVDALDALDGFEALDMGDDADLDEGLGFFLPDDDKPPIAISVVGGDLTGLPAEVDHEGHIEYKLKLLTPSPLRMAKLVTQLKWRLVEGGGMALYELGILDNGTLVGLSQSDMQESLDTLGKMLSALGGGEIRIGRVVQVSGRSSISPEGSPPTLTPDASESELSDSSTPPPSTPKTHSTGGGHPMKTAVAMVFESFVVSPLSDAEAIAIQTPLPLSSNIVTCPRSGTTSTIAPIAIKPKIAPHPERTPEERAALKRAKRDAHRKKVESQPGWSMKPPRPRRGEGEGKGGGGGGGEEGGHGRWDGAAKSKSHSNVKQRQQQIEHQQRKEAKLLLAQSAPPGTRISHKPVSALRPTPAKDGEVRYVVEAVVLKKGGLRKSKAREPTVVGGREELEEDGEEGWRYIEFDFVGAAKRKCVAGSL